MTTGCSPVLREVWTRIEEIDGQLPTKGLLHRAFEKMIRYLGEEWFKKRAIPVPLKRSCK